MDDRALPRRILVVEDEADIRDLLAETLTEEYRVEVAVDGVEALERLEQGPLPDAILLDLFLPRLSGFELLERLRAAPALARIPVVTMTASSCQPPRGTWGHLHKPFAIPHAFALIAAVIARARGVVACNPFASSPAAASGPVLALTPAPSPASTPLPLVLAASRS